ncbi:hypothetical protein RJ527_00750 [Thalassospiraceae bacterium LMO-SO8]|nr:hypothetical protein [Alphaproteobacteria bacterium LMO-S08]WND76285.1 hypothetical protein RJ527_00750 [Thalassospiraceae bacterium LMO-SO8]
MNLYFAGAALGTTMSAAVTAVWILGPGGSIDGVGAQSAARTGQVYDMQVSPYLARVDYQGGSSALVPISIAFRVTDKQAGAEFCRDLARVQMEVKSFMQANVRGPFSWPNVAASGLDKQLADRINGVLGRHVIDRVFMAAGDQGVGDRPTSCARLARM